MKLYKALKRRARLKGEISNLESRIQACISELVDNNYKEDYLTLTVKYDEKKEELTTLKLKIMATNIEGEAFSQILKLGELKDKITLINSLDIREGVVERRHFTSDQTTKYKSQMSEVNQIKLVEELQVEIESITDWLDDFNAKTDVPD